MGRLMGQTPNLKTWLASKFNEHYNLVVRKTLASEKFTICIVFVIGFMLYSQLIGSPFLNFDDLNHIPLNPGFQKSDLLSLWMEPYFVMYVPVIYSIWYGIWKMLGPESWPFHAFNVSLHCMNTLLIYFLLQRFGTGRKLAFLCALAFEVHPLQVESVAWISEGRGLAAATFGLIATFLWLSRGLRQIKGHFLAGLKRVPRRAGPQIEYSA